MTTADDVRRAGAVALIAEAEYGELQAATLLRMTPPSPGYQATAQIVVGCHPSSANVKLWSAGGSGGRILLETEQAKSLRDWLNNMFPVEVAE